MTKLQKEKKSRPLTREEKPFIPPKYQHLAAIILLYLSLIIFLNQVIFEGKTFLGVDTIASHSFDTVVKEAREQGIFPLWNPYIFCGMPSYGSLTYSGDRFFDLIGTLLGYTTSVFRYVLTLNSPVGWVIFYYFAFAAGMYALTFSKVRNKVAALLAGLGAIFSTYIIEWIMIGHNTKIAVICWLPWLLLLIENLRIKFDWKYAVLLIPTFHFIFLPGHVQMIFYVFLTVGIYFIFFFIQTVLQKQNWKGVLIAGCVVAVAAVFAFAMDADKYLSVLEYNPYSMRGAAPIVKEPGTEGKTLEGGLAYDYATDWSFAPGEMMTFLIPSWYGFGIHTYDGKLTRQPLKVNTYWGPERWVNNPPYMGIIILLFAVLGFVRFRKEPFVQFLAVLIAFALLVSFGREFSLVYDLMFKYFPYFNKFRIPIMILVLVHTFIPLVAAYGISSVMNGRPGFRPDAEKKWKYAVYGATGFLVLALAGRDVFVDIYSGFFPFKEMASSIARMVGTRQAEVLSEFYNFIVDTVMTDLYVALILIIIVLGACWLYLKGNLKFAALSFVLVVAVIADLWRVDSKPMEPKPRGDQQAYFTAPPYVKFLQKDTTLYRTLTFIDGQPPYDNTLAYWKIQNAYGYQGAKMRAYQDMVDVGGIGNPLVWQLMDVKYIISNTPDSSSILQLVYNGNDRKVYFNRASLPRAFFVNRYAVASGLDILKKIAAISFNPTDVAYFTEDPKIQIDPPQSGAKADFVRYGMQDFTMDITATGNNLLFLSETYYPNGWKAFLDGKEIPIYRLDYLFRGVAVPAGTHTLEMKFEPRGFAIGKNLSLGANILALGALGFIAYDWRRKRKGSGGRPLQEEAPDKDKSDASTGKEQGSN
jgi:hypothetical protein